MPSGETSHTSPPGAIGSLGLSGLLRHWAAVKPDALALADPPDKDRLGLGASRRLTFAQTNTAVDRIAAHLLASGVAPGAIVALQAPHTTEAMLAALACLRAGICAAIAPFAWRRHEIAAAFASLPVDGAIGSWATGGRAQAHVLTAAGVRNADLCFAFAFGHDAPDSLIILDDLIDDDDTTPSPADEERGGAAFLHFAPQARAMPLIVPRSNQDLVAAGLASSAAAGLTDRTVLLSAFPISGVTGLAGFFAPWLVTGASLILHHPFDDALFVRQLSDEGVTFTALPAEVADEVESELALHTSNPPIVARVYSLPPPKTALPDDAGAAREFDFLNIAEFALLARQAPDMPATWLPLGVASQAAGDAPITFLETRLRGKILRKEASSMLSGELCLRGASAPTLLGAFAQFNPGASVVDADGFINTGLKCAFADAGMRLIACAPQPLLARLGGVAIDMEELDRLYAAFPGFLDAAAFTIPDRLLGERIFAAVAPPPGESVAEADFRLYLESLDIAPFKFPEKLVVVKYVPRNADGGVLRERILSEI